MATSNRSRLVDVLTEDLVLERWQIEPRSGASLFESNLEDEYFEVDCLVSLRGGIVKWTDRLNGWMHSS